MSAPLTAIERSVYHYLIDFLAENTYQPSVREIGRRFRLKSTKTVVDILQSLALKGYVTREAGRSRGLRLTGFESVGHTQPVPLYSKIGSAEPVLAEENRERFIAMDRMFVPSDDAFFVKVEDDAMRGRGIQRGDLVLVNPAARAHDGDAVVARIAGDSVVRLVSHRGAQVVLTAASPDEQEVTLGPSDDFAVLGTVAAVLRPFHTDGMSAAYHDA